METRPLRSPGPQAERMPSRASSERAETVTPPRIAGGIENLPSRCCGTCERMHPHSYDLLRGAGFVVMEQQQSAPNSGRCRPDLTILDTHREPLAFIEIVRSNRPTNSLRVAEELGIPLFTILAPHRRSLVPGLRPSRPWWGLRPKPAGGHQEADVLHGTSGGRDDAPERRWRLSVGGPRYDAGRRRESGLCELPRLPAQPGGPHVSEDGEPDCCGAVLMGLRQRQWRCSGASSSWISRTPLSPCARLWNRTWGGFLLEAIRGAKDGTSRFVVPVGSEEVHVEMSLKPLNPHIGPNDPPRPESSRTTGLRRRES